MTLPKFEALLENMLLNLFLAIIRKCTEEITTESSGKFVVRLADHHDDDDYVKL